MIIGAPDELIPNVEQEIKTIRSFLPHSNVLYKEDAIIPNIKAHFANANIIHFACHGEYNKDNPLFSFLKLHNTHLTVRDIYELKTKAELVVLSACDTGLNTISAGDELLGLARGFFYAGAPSLVLSLWKAHDEATMEIMSSFYEQLSKGKSKAEALRKAQLSVKDKWQHPFFWGAFILMGAR